jgi:hypothetical protein
VIWLFACSDRPPFDKLRPNYYQGVWCVMEIVSGLLHAAPDSTEVFFGNTPEEPIQPNYQVICRGRSFVFRGLNIFHSVVPGHISSLTGLTSCAKAISSRPGFFRPCRPGGARVVLRRYLPLRDRRDQG